MTEAFIYDHVRTPRGRGREDGSLHEITSVELATQLLEALRDRNELDTALLDDVILGTAQPVGEQGGVLARAAVLNAGYAQTVGGQQVNRFCASGLDSVNLIAAQVMAGMIKGGIGGGVESNEFGRNWAMTAAHGQRIRRLPSATITCHRASAPI